MQPDRLVPSTPPPGVAIHVHADMIMDIIESERTKAIADAQNQLEKYQRVFNACREQCLQRVIEHGGNQQMIVEIQNRFAQILEHPPSGPLPDFKTGTSHQIQNEAADKQPFELFQLALKPLGIAFSGDGNSLQLEPGWKTILAELGITRLEEFMERLTTRLHCDRTIIVTLKQKNMAYEQEQARAAYEYQTTVTALNSEISRLRRLLLSHAGPHSHPPSLQTSPVPPVPQPAFIVNASNMSHSVPLDTHPQFNELPDVRHKSDINVHYAMSSNVSYPPQNYG